MSVRPDAACRGTERALPVGAEGPDGPVTGRSHAGEAERLSLSRPSRCGVPEPRQPVAVAGNDLLAAGAERHGKDRGIMHERWPDGLAGRGVPELRRRIRATRRDRLAVGAEGHGNDLVLVPHRRPDGPAGGGVPESRRVVGAGRRDGLAIGAEGHGVDRALVFQGWAVRCADVEVPEADGPGVAAGHE